MQLAALPSESVILAVSTASSPDSRPLSGAPHSKRDVRLDFLRGLCLIVMTINHLPMMTLQRFTYETFGYFTSAEGFVLISGITSGWVYSSSGGWPQANRILRRCAFVGLVYVLLMFLLSAMPGGHASWSARQDRAGILLMYIVYLFFLPLVLRLFDAGRGQWLLGASLGLWVLAQWKIGPQVGIGYLLAWQFLFFAGAWFGYCRRRRIFWPGFRSPAMRKALAAGCLLFFFSRHPLVRPPLFELAWEITSKELVGLVRMLNIAAFAFFIVQIPRLLYGRWMALGVSRAVSFLGSHSLHVFAWHVLIVWMIKPYALQWTAAGLSLQILMTTAVVASLFIPAYLHAGWRVAGPARSSFVRWLLQ